MNSLEKGNIGEGFVNNIAFHSFLEYWCYPSPKDELGDKKEICDLLILFESNLVIVSVKNYKFNDLYSRYFKQTIEKAAKQIYGAERKLLRSNRDIIIKHPKKQKERFPKETIKNIHRVIINLGEGVRFYPFNMETLDNKFISLFDKAAFETIVKELDTIPDFLEYLTKREELFSGKSVTILPGEENDFPFDTSRQFFDHSEQKYVSSENQGILISGTEHDLLARYLIHQRTFPEPLRSKDYNYTFIQLDGSWEDFNKRKQVIKKRELDRNSYFLDELVKREVLTNMNEKSIELATVLMSFNRFDRRVISNNFMQFFEMYKDAEVDTFARRYSDFNGTGIVFAFYHQMMPQQIVNTLIDIAIDSFCLYSNYKSKRIILIATTNEFKQFKMGLLNDITPFSKDKELQIKEDVELLGWFTNHTEIKVNEKEYPDEE